MKAVTAFKTEDGKMFENEALAQQHERELRLRKEYEADPVGEAYHYLSFNQFLEYLEDRKELVLGMLKLV